jgi:hypothetical protein
VGLVRCSVVWVCLALMCMCMRMRCVCSVRSHHPPPSSQSDHLHLHLHHSHRAAPKRAHSPSVLLQHRTLALILPHPHRLCPTSARQKHTHEATAQRSREPTAGFHTLACSAVALLRVCPKHSFTLRMARLGLAHDGRKHATTQHVSRFAFAFAFAFAWPCPAALRSG